MLDEQWANLVFDLLRQEVGAEEKDREDFLSYLAKSSDYKEFRFCGDLGLGGKFYLTRHDWRVNFYKEDSNARREALKVKVNALLAEMRETWLKG